MLCKNCKNEIPDGSIFCMFCGNKIIKDKKKKPLLTVPKPKKLKSGNYRIQLFYEGKRYSITKETEAAATAEAIAIKNGLIQARKKSGLTVGAAVDEYIKANENILSPSTIRNYKVYRNNHFQELMQKDIDSVNNWQNYINQELKLKVKSNINSKKERSISPKTVINSWRLITAALKYKNYSIPAVNLPKYTKKEKEFLDFEEINILLAACRGTEAEIGIILGLHSLRRSELAAITAEDIDRKNKTIKINKAAVFNSNNELIIKNATKTEKSAREIPIMIDRLLEITENKTGKLVQYNINWLYGKVNELCEENALPLVGVHGLRHSFASLAYHLKWSALHTMEVGGWSNYDTVEKIYTHLAKQDRNRDINKMAKFYNSSFSNIPKKQARKTIFKG